MKKIIVVLSCLMLSIPLMANITDLNKGDIIKLYPEINSYQIIDYQSEQEKYKQEQLWKYTKFIFFVGMSIVGWNTRTDYGIIAGTTFIFFAGIAW